MSEDNLFGEITILSPQEVENMIPAKDEVTNEEETVKQNGEVPAVTKGQEFTITPVTTTVEEGEKNETTTSSNENGNEAVYKALIKELHKEGIITTAEADKLDEIPGTFDSIKKLMQETVDSTVKEKEESWKKGFSSAKKRFLEIEDAFSDVDQAILTAQRLEYFDTLTEAAIKADVNLQKNLYFEQLKAKNFTDDEAVEAIKEAEDLNKLEEKSLKALPDLKSSTSKLVEKNRELLNQHKEDSVKSQTEEFEKLMNSVDSTESFVEGLPLTKIGKDKLKANFTTIVHKDEKTGKEFNSLMYKQYANPVEFEKLINYYDTIGLFNLDNKTKSFKPDITKLKTAAKTAAVNELDKVIAAKEHKGVGENTALSSTKTESILDMLKSATKAK